MDIEKKVGIVCLIIGMLSFILMFITNGLISYLFYILFVPNILYGVGIFIVPKTRRKKLGKIPFRGY